MKLLLLTTLAAVCTMQAQQKFRVKSKRTPNRHSVYTLEDEKGNTLRELDSSNYMVCFSEDQWGYFAVFAIKGQKGWIAIDAREQQLFEVYNTSFGEPSPDELRGDRIRIVDQYNKIGFADKKGKIVIKPQFEMVSSFHKGKAIVGESCRKIPWGPHEEEPGGCHHYSVACNKHGYIDHLGNLKMLEDLSFEELAKKIKWKPEW